MPALHLLCTIQGGYTLTGLTEESWQVGIRCYVSNASADDVGPLPTDIDVVASTVHRVETNWVIDSNWALSGPVGWSFKPTDWLNDQVLPAVGTWHSNGRVSAGCNIQRVSVYPIGPDGRTVAAPPYAAGSPAVAVFTSGHLPVGTATGGIAPLQIAPVASWRTTQVGRRGRGRIYVPGVPLTQLSQTGRLASIYVTNRLSDCVTLLQSMSYHRSVPDEAAVVPIVTGAPWTEYGVIREVRFGDIGDTQRRRRRSLTEAYSSATPVYP